MRCVVFAACAAVSLAAPAWAEETATAPIAAPAAAAAQPAPQRVKGTIAAFDPMTRLLSVTAGTKRKPVTITVGLAPNLRVFTNQKRKVADIKAGDFVGASALKSADGKLRAQQVNVFPEEMRGMGEGQYPMGDPSANRLMTNATVAGVTSVAPNNGTLTVSYRGAAPGADGVCGGHANTAGSPGCTGDAQILVAPGIPVIAVMLGDESLLVPGAAVSLITTASADGTAVATRLTVEKDGVKPIL